MQPLPETAAASSLTTELIDRALLHGTFTLRSGVVTDRYFDKFSVTTDPQLLRRVAAAFAEMLDQLKRKGLTPPARIVAPELGAVPLAAALALHTDLPFVIVRGAEKTYGTSQRIEGPFEAGEHAILVEDVVTSGGAAFEALTAARDAGLIIDATLCVLDRGGDGSSVLANAGAPLTSLLTPASIA